METEKQESYRKHIIEKYEERAWECLALYNYYGGRYAGIEANCKKLDAQIEQTEQKIKELEAEGNSKENYEKIKFLKEEIKKMQKQIDGVGDIAKKFFEKAASYQEEGGRILEQVDDFKVFKLKTPEQIEADKHAPNTEEKVEEVK